MKHRHSPRRTGAERQTRKPAPRLVFTTLLRTALFLTACAPGVSFAQARLTVTVRDAAGDVAADAQVRLLNEATGRVFTARTDARGAVRFGPLSTAGAWTVTATGPEGMTAASAPLTLRANFERAVALTLSSEIEEIVVTGRRAVAAINAVNAEVSSSFTAAELERLPIEARSLEASLLRLPNVTAATGFFNEAPTIAINGANSLFTNYAIDGLDNNENFLGGQKFPTPIGIVQDVTVLANNYSVEFGRTANGVVNVTTKSGSNELAGEGFFILRPGDVLTGDDDADGASLRDLNGNPVSEDFARFQFGGSIGGPIVEDRTFFFLNAEYTRDESDNLLTADALGISETVDETNEFLLLTGKIDHRWSDRFASTLRVHHGRVKNERAGGGISGGITFPTAGNVQDRFSTHAAFSTTYTGAAWDYVGSFQYSRFDWDFGEPLFGEGPQATLLDVDGQAIATVGETGFIFDETENTFQTQHKASVEFGRHRLKFGLDVIHARFDLFGGGNVDGNFGFQLTRPLTDAELGAVSAIGAGLDFADVAALPVSLEAATFETREAAISAEQTTYSVYLEDQVRARDDLTLTFGLRWEYDSLSDGASGSGDFNNIAPRFAANWRVRDDLSLRAGAGLFYEKLPYAVVSDALQFSAQTAVFTAQLEDLVTQGVLPAGTNVAALTNEGNRAVDLVAGGLCDTVAQCQAVGADAAAGLFDTLPPAELRILSPFGYDNPFAIQATLGVQWAPEPYLTLYADLILSEGRNLVRLRDLNAPSPFVVTPADVAGADDLTALPRSQEDADLTRPVGAPTGGARAIILSETEGRSEYRALNLTANKDFGGPFFGNFWAARVSYTLSRLENDTDDINFRAADANTFAADFGPSLNDRTHVVSAIFTGRPIENLTATVAVLAQSGQPVTFLPSAADFGTTDLNGDGLSFADQFTGNPDRFPGTERNEGRLPWATTVDVGVAYRVPVPYGGLEIRADVFNLFNARNETGFPVNFTLSNQRQTLTVADGFATPFDITAVSPPRTLQITTRYVF